MPRTKGAKNFKLTDKQNQRIKDLYASDMPRQDVVALLVKELGISTRSITNIAKELGLTHHNKLSVIKDNILIYDIETSRVPLKAWWTGKTYIDHKQLLGEPTMISVAWKWLGEDEVHSLTWDKNHCDKAMMKKFLKVYNKASMIIGQNNNSFDNKWINTRAAKHGLKVNRFVKSFDIYRMAKKYFRLPSYSMAYMARYFGLTLKQSHEGIHMWNMIEDGNKEQQKEYLEKMVAYNKGDIVTTEELYMTLRPYFGSVTNNAVKYGLPAWACPVSGSKDVKLHDTLYTEAGTVQRIMYCKHSDHQYKITNKAYMDFLQRAMTEHWNNE